MLALKFYRSNFTAQISQLKFYRSDACLDLKNIMSGLVLMIYNGG